MKLKQKCTNGIYISNYNPNILCLMYADNVANCADTCTVVNFQKTVKCH